MSKQRFVLGTLVGLACGLPTMAANGQSPAAPLAAQGSAEDAREQLAGSTGQGSAGWRYRKFNGQWWYFLPNQQWARWDGRQWTVPSSKAGAYQEWRNEQFASRYSDSAARDAERRRQDVDRWRERATKGYPSSKTLGPSDADYHAQVDRFHDYLMITPYDYRIGTQGHGLFDCNPDLTIANTTRFNYATSNGGYMGGALRTPYGY